MKKKNIFIMKTIRSLLVTGLLITILTKNTNTFSRIIILPFIIACLLSVVKNICLYANKPNYANIFNKLYTISFIIFWFGFLIFICYLSFKSNNYLLLIFSIPFWLVGIYIIRKYLFKTNSRTTKNNKININFPVIIGSFLIGLVLIIGIVCLVIGIKDTYKLNNISKNYLTTTGYLIDYDIYNQDKDGTTYQLIYQYQVDNQQYTVTTDYGVGSIPELGSIREIKYNPDNYQEALISGTNSKNGLIYFGLFFILGATVFILAAMQMHGLFDKIKFDILGIYIGFVCFIIGVGIFMFQHGTTSSIIATIKLFGFWILIPITFIVVGIMQIIKSLVNKKSQ